jgi:uncharacterized protein YkwD
MAFSTALLLLATLAAEPVCGTDGGEAARRALLEELNAARAEAGTAALAPHPALCEAARRRAAAVAVRGEIDSSIDVMRGINTALHRDGYDTQRWIESTLIGSRDDGVLEPWRDANPRWLDDAIGGQFEHVGIGFARWQGRPVYTLLLAWTQRSEAGLRAKWLADLEWVRETVLADVNEARAENRRHPVERDAALDLAAQRHAEDMLRRAYYDHQSPEGHTVARRAREAGYDRPGGVGENIAKGIFDPRDAVRRWLDSPGHRANVLRKKARWMGVGVAFGDNDNGFEVLWVQVFGG